MLDSLEREKERDSLRNIIVRKVCDQLDRVRKTTMLICEEISTFFRHFDYDPHRDGADMGAYYIGLFHYFGEDMQLLNNSILSEYIPFSNDYDPLLLKPTRSLTKYYEEGLIEENSSARELFDLNISYLYRLMRAQQEMEGYLEVARREGI